MATTWKKVLTEDSSIPTSQIAGVGTANYVPYVDAAGALAEVDLGAGAYLGGRGSGIPLPTTIGDTLSNGSDIAAGTLSGNVLQLSINNNAVTNAMMADNAISPAEIKHHTGLGVIAYDSSGVPANITASGANKVLKTDANGTAFEFGDANDAATVAVNLNSTNAAVPVHFGGVNDTDNDTGVTISKDTANAFTYNPATTFAKSSSQPNVTAVTDGSAALTVAGGIKADLLGTATIAGSVEVSDSSADASYDLVFVTGTGQQKILSDADGINYNPGEKALTVANLIVTGNNTVVNTTELVVEDKTLRVAGSSTSSSNSTSANAGLVVNVGISNYTSSDEDGALTVTNEDGFLPRVIWSNGANTTKGWAIATVGVADDTAGTEVDGVAIDDNLKTASTLHGIAVMHHTTDATTDGASVASTIGDIGVGAFYLSTDGNGSLYVQTA